MAEDLRGIPGGVREAARHLALVAGVAVVAAGGMACGAVGGDGAVIDWDLSSGHRRADVDWPSGDSDGRTIDDVKSVRIRLPGGPVVEERKDIEQVLLDRQEEVVEDVVVYFPNETAERAVERARTMAGRYGLDDKGTFEKLLQEVAALRGKNIDDGSGPSAGAGYPDDHKVGPDESALEVRILAAPDPDRRWYVQLRLDWVAGESYDWDLSKTHTVADVGGGFPSDRSAEAYVPNISNLRIALVGNQEFRVEVQAGEVRMLRAGDVITRLQASFGEPTPEAAHRRAVELADQWGAQTSSVDNWLSVTTTAARLGQGGRASRSRPRQAARGRQPPRGDRPALRTALQKPIRATLGRRLRPHLGWVNAAAPGTRPPMPVQEHTGRTGEARPPFACLLSSSPAGTQGNCHLTRVHHDGWEEGQAVGHGSDYERAACGAPGAATATRIWRSRDPRQSLRPATTPRGEARSQTDRASEAVLLGGEGELSER